MLNDIESAVKCAEEVISDGTKNDVVQKLGEYTDQFNKFSESVDKYMNCSVLGELWNTKQIHLEKKVLINHLMNNYEKNQFDEEENNYLNGQTKCDRCLKLVPDTERVTGIRHSGCNVCTDCYLNCGLVTSISDDQTMEDMMDGLKENESEWRNEDCNIETHSVSCNCSQTDK